jgi:hypothetical protein
LYIGFKAAGLLHNPPLYDQYSPLAFIDAVKALLKSIDNCLKKTVMFQKKPDAKACYHSDCAKFQGALIKTMESRFKDIGLTIDSPHGEPNEKSWEDFLC